MTIPLGGGKLNLNPCTPEEEARNWQLLNQIINNLFQTLSEAGVTDTFKVAVDAPNVATPDYLNDQMYYDTSGGIVDTWPNMGVPVVADVSSAKERLRVDFSQIPGFVEIPVDYSGQIVLKLAGDIDVGPFVTWALLSEVTDANTVFISSTDSVASYFHDCITNTDAIVGSADLIVVGNVEGDPATNQTETFAVDVSAITGWHAAEFRLLGIEANVSTYFTITYTGSLLIADSTFITDLETIFDTRYVLKGNIRKGRCTVAIPPATGPLTAQWGTTGKVDLQHPTTGVLSGVAVFVDNDNIGEDWVVDAQVVVDMDCSPPRVLGGSCGAKTWS